MIPWCTLTESPCDQNLHSSFFFMRKVFIMIRWNSEWVLSLCASGDQQASSPGAADNAGFHVVWRTGWQSNKLLQSLFCDPEHSAEEQGRRTARTGNVYINISMHIYCNCGTLWPYMLTVICTLGPRDVGSASCPSAEHYRRTGEHWNALHHECAL